MSKSQIKAPLLFIDSVHKGCFVEEQQFFKTPKSTPTDVKRTDYVHHYEQKTASDFHDWPEESTEE